MLSDYPRLSSSYFFSMQASPCSLIIVMFALIRRITNLLAQGTHALVVQSQGKGADKARMPIGRAPAPAGCSDQTLATQGVDGDDYCLVRVTEEQRWIRKLFCYAQEQPAPLKCDYSNLMGSTIINRDRSYSISSTVMCIEAQSRRAYEKIHGSGSFIFNAMGEAAAEYLKRMCEWEQVWNREKGAISMEAVLEVTLASKGIQTAENNVYLQLKDHAKLFTSMLSAQVGAYVIHTHGPVVGVLYVDEKYFRCKVYRGGKPREVANHAVVCIGYCFIGDMLLVKVKDNHTPEGPIRWVLYEAFDEFHILNVDHVKPASAWVLDILRTTLDLRKMLFF